jgi:hypothetical protein
MSSLTSQILTRAASAYFSTAFGVGIVLGFLSALPVFVNNHGNNIDRHEVVSTFSKGMLTGLAYPVTIPYFALGRNSKPYHSPSSME